MDYQEWSEQFINLTKTARHILLVSHRDPDFDTLGANLALASYFQNSNQSAISFCETPLTSHQNFFTTASFVNNLPSQKINLIITLDIGDENRSGIKNFLQNHREILVINIDHHASNTNFGEVNFVDQNASSTCEIIYNLLAPQSALNKKIATNLMVGLITDTSGFSNLATSSKALATAAKLMNFGVNLNSLMKKLLRSHSVPILNLWGKALSRLKLTSHKITTTYITHNDLKNSGLDHTAVEGIANFLNVLALNEKMEAVLVLSEFEKGIIKGSLRTTNPLIDVSKFAMLLGGGGHKKAAGFHLNGHITNI